MQLLGLRQAGGGVGDVESGLLVRVLAVAQRLLPRPRATDLGVEAGAVSGVADRRSHPLGHGDVVAGRVAEGLGREALALLLREATTADRLEDLAVAAGVGDDRDGGVVLRRGPDHRRATDVDLLDAVLHPGARGDGVGEGVEVDDDEVEGGDLQLLELADVVGQPGVGEDAGVHARVQGLDPAVEALGEPGELLDLGHGQAEPLDRGGGATGGDELHAGLGEATDEVLQPGLVEDRDEGTADGTGFGHEYSW